MNKTKLFTGALAGSLLIVGITTVLPTQTGTAPANASVPVLECPPPTSEGAYFERGIDKESNVICGFSYYNECPYASAYAADDPMCEKARQSQEPAPAVVEPVQPAPPQPTNQCGGK
jgi:hypothetical protein